MKTEFEIAKENIKRYELNKDNKNFGHGLLWECETHKASCQRFLEFLKKIYSHENKQWLSDDYTMSDLKKKITDLEQAIKLYEENGI